jgi:hypothetical protein
VASALGLSRVEFKNLDAASLRLCRRSYDVVTSLSVLEHIPGEGDRQAFESLWESVAPGGTLVVTVPCARRGFEEFIDYNEYGLLQENDSGFVFGQRFYDADMLNALSGLRRQNRARARYTAKSKAVSSSRTAMRTAGHGIPARGANLPSLLVRFDAFRALEDLPGIGVIAMRFERARHETSCGRSCRESRRRQPSRARFASSSSRGQTRARHHLPGQSVGNGSGRASRRTGKGGRSRIATRVATARERESFWGSRAAPTPYAGCADTCVAVAESGCQSLLSGRCHRRSTNARASLRRRLLSLALSA